MLLLSLPWLLLALAAWRATNVEGPSDDEGRRGSRSAKTTQERAVGGSPDGVVEELGEGKTRGVMAVTASHSDGSQLASHDAAGAEPADVLGRFDEEHARAFARGHDGRGDAARDAAVNYDVIGFRVRLGAPACC